MDARSLKKPKLEDVTGDDCAEDEEVLQLLIKHRSVEVQLLKKKVAFYQSELEDAEKKLVAAQLKLRCRSSSSEPQAGSPTLGNGSSSCTSSRPQLIIPALDHTSKTQMAAKGALLIGLTPKSGSRSSAEDSKGESLTRPKVPIGSQKIKKKHKIEPKVHKDLIPSVCSCSSSSLINFESITHIPSQHNRKMRCLEPNPTDDRMFVTSALNGAVNLWQLQSNGTKPSALLLSTTDCEIPGKKKWPENLVWHPDGDMLFCVYRADGGNPQVSTVDLNAARKDRVTFLAEKPHVKGIINSIIFLHGVDLCFATGGSDHAVVLWNENNGAWKPKTLHRDQHSSAVKGVAGLQHKKILLSVGLDKKIIGFDLLAEKCEFKQQTNYHCMSVLPNPRDFNLYMVQTGAPTMQLRLFDIRSRGREIHSFGWKQESSESQSSLISQAWSHDGWRLSSGSVDPAIHLFDIRYTGKEPSQTVRAHQLRVFKAIWHQSIPLLTSISSDQNICLHKMH